MPLLNWFSPHKTKAADAPATAPASSGLSRLDSSKPGHGARHHGTAHPGSRKQERLERRELLYAVIRESMLRAGVLFSGYKFKVLSLDPHGRQFLVMVDLAQGAGIDADRWSRIEDTIAHSARSRHDILVSAVYWRAGEQEAGAAGKRGDQALAMVNAQTTTRGHGPQTGFADTELSEGADAQEHLGSTQPGALR